MEPEEQWGPLTALCHQKKENYWRLIAAGIRSILALEILAVLEAELQQA
jgi:hypothetical protein